MRESSSVRLQSGIALLTALVVAALAAAIAVALARQDNSATVRTTQLVTRHDVRRATDALDRVAIDVLVQDARGEPVDGLADTWARQSVEARAGGVTASGRLRDVQGLFNINDLALHQRILSGAVSASPPPPGDGLSTNPNGGPATALVERQIVTRAPNGEKMTMTVLDRPGQAGTSPPGVAPAPDGTGATGAAAGTPGAPGEGRDAAPSPQEIATARFLLLLGALSIDPAVADAILDWLDEDGDTRFPNGAEDDYYSKLDPPYRAANGPLADVTELLLVRGVSPETLAKLRPFVVVLPTFTPINVNTAPVEVLMSLGPGIDRGTAEGLVRQRDIQVFRSVDAFVRSPILIGRPVSATGLAVQSRYFVLRSQVDNDDVVRYDSLFDREGSSQPRRLLRQRRFGDG